MVFIGSFVYVALELLGIVLAIQWLGFAKAFFLWIGLAFIGLTIGIPSMRNMVRQNAAITQDSGPALARRFLMAPAERMLFILGGFLLFWPGYISSIAGISVMFGPTRRRVIHFLMQHFERTFRRVQRTAEESFISSWVVNHEGPDLGTFEAKPDLDEREVQDWLDHVNPDDFKDK